MRANVLVAVSFDEADRIKDQYSDYLFYVVVTPDSEIGGDFTISRLVWTPAATELPARTRLALRGKLASRMASDTVQNDFFKTLSL